MATNAVNYLATCIKVGAQEICDAIPTPAAGGGGIGSRTATLGDLVSRLMLFAFPIAGLILFVVLIAAGFEYMNSAGEASKIESAWKKITYALIGFGLLLISFFIVRTVAAIIGFESPI
ncbi:MAG: hypothetical protein U0525_00080 [Patescibacteria group bacterium]